MATIRVFEELEIWQMAATQCQTTYDLIEEGRFDFDAPLADQINRSSGSVMDNIAEGFDRFSKADFRHFLIVARGSNAEVRSQLYRAKARKHLSEEESLKAIEYSRYLGVRINAFIKYLDKSMFEAKPKESADAVSEPAEEYLSAKTLQYDFPDDIIQSQ